MGTQVKLQAILLSNEHLQKIETNKPHTETWIYSQPHASNKFCTSTLQIQPQDPRHPGPCRAPLAFLCYWH